MPKKRRPKQRKPDVALTQRQQMFIEHLSQDPRRNLAEAARRAGYNCQKDSAFKKVGWELMNSPRYAKVQAAHQLLMEERRARWTNTTDARILEVLTAMVLVPRHRIARPGPDGRLICTPVEDLWPEEEWLIDYYRQTTLNDGSGETVLQPVLVSRLKALELLAKARGLFVDRVRHEGKISLEDERRSLRAALDELSAHGYPGPPLEAGLATDGIDQNRPGQKAELQSRDGEPNNNAGLSE